MSADASWTAWKEYQPLASWLSGLWEAGKLSHQQYEALSSAFRTGHAKRRRDVMEVERTERERAVSAHIRQELTDLEASNALVEYRSFPEVETFVASFSQCLNAA